jgi:RimJ/RimL family protein N-acetyltransferase
VTVDVKLRPAVEQDRLFVEAVYFETQRWIVEQLFGWRGDEFEQTNFRNKFYKEQDSSIIVADGDDVGWMAVERDGKSIHLDGIYITRSAQSMGIGSHLIRHLMNEAKMAALPLTLSAAKINPATKLYERLGFAATHTDEFKVYMTFWPDAGKQTSMPNDETVLVEVNDSDFEWMLRGKQTANGELRLPPGGVDDVSVLEIVRGITRRLHEANCRKSWMVVSKDEVVGLCSYRRPPSDGRVEIGYGIAQSCRGMGHATRAIAAIVSAARQDSDVRVVMAETSVNNPASARVLEKNGFERTGSRLDVEDGEVVTWQSVVR